MDVAANIYILYGLVAFLLVSLLVLAVYFTISPATTENRLFSRVKGVYPPVRAATTDNVDLQNAPNPFRVDQVNVTAGDVLLVWQQTDPSENGLYRFGKNNRFVRTESLSHSSQIVSGNDVFVFEGASFGQTRFVLEANSLNPVLGTTDLRFVPQNYAQFDTPLANNLLITSDTSTTTKTSWKDLRSLMGAQYVTLQGAATEAGLGASAWLTRIGGVVQLFWQYPVRAAVVGPTNILSEPVPGFLRPATEITANVWGGLPATSGLVRLSTTGELTLENIDAALAPADPVGVISYAVETSTLAIPSLRVLKPTPV